MMIDRLTVLETAGGLITGERAEAYGNFREQMLAIAQAFNALTGRDDGLGAADIALILQLLKLRRMRTSPDVDGAVDLCGYTALYAEYFM